MEYFDVNSKPKINAFEYSIYHGNKNKYGIVEINAENIDRKNTPEVKRGSVLYFESPDIKDVDRHCINLKEVKYIDSPGISSLLVFKTENREQGYPKPIIAGIQDYVLSRLELTGCHIFFDYINDISELASNEIEIINYKKVLKRLHPRNSKK